jgi:hypothetical protein
MCHIHALTVSGTSSSSFGRSCEREIVIVVSSKLMWQNMWAYQTVTNNPCTYINAELVSRMDNTMKILFFFTLVVNIDAVCPETCLICKEHRRNKELLTTSCIKSHGEHF